MVLEIVRDYLGRIKKTPKDMALEMRYEKEVKAKKKEKNKLVTEYDKLNRSLAELSVEIGKSLTGQSDYAPDVLKMSIKMTTDQINELNKKIAECDKELTEKNEMLSKIDFYYDKFKGWADEFDNATLEQQKMIICQLINSIKVRRGYELELEFNVSYEQFFKN